MIVFGIAVAGVCYVAGVNGDEIEHTVSLVDQLLNTIKEV
jgi:hypothetical protein